ncbi:MAG: methylmalonyl-CoA epimerase [Planctomycetes bacterium]|nr:methylmalonyl-CoA epimerase [Planctomycetota bacterium]
MTASEGRLLGVEHLGVAVPNAAAAGEAFRTAFGLEPGHTEVLPEHGVKTEFYALGRGAEIEFIEPLDSANSIGRYLERQGSGIHHVALRVAGLDSLLEAMKSRGVRLIDERARVGAQGKRVAFIHPRSMGGILVELVEHPAGEQ